MFLYSQYSSKLVTGLFSLEPTWLRLLLPLLHPSALAKALMTSMVLKPRVVKAMVLKPQSSPPCPVGSISCRRPLPPWNTCSPAFQDPLSPLVLFLRHYLLLLSLLCCFPLLFLTSSVWSGPGLRPDLLLAPYTPSLVISSRLSVLDAVSSQRQSSPPALSLYPAQTSSLNAESRSCLLIQHLHQDVSKYLRFNSTKLNPRFLPEPCSTQSRPPLRRRQEHPSSCSSHKP